MADRLAREPSADEVDRLKVVLSDVSDIFVSLHVRPVLREHPTAPRVNLYLPLDDHARALEAEIESPRYRKTDFQTSTQYRPLPECTGISYNAAMSNKYTYSVPFTEEELLHDYTVSLMSQTEIGTKYNTTQHVVWRAMKKMGIATRKAKKRNQYGSLNSSWKGGRVLSGASKRQRGERAAFGNGYYYVLQPDHPNAGSGGYVAEHIAKITKHIGRALCKGEVVHHINLNKHDNSIANLAVSNRKQHAIWHNQLEEAAVILMKQGLISFTPENGYAVVRQKVQATDTAE